MAIIEDPRHHSRQRPAGASAFCLASVLAGLVVIALLVNLLASLLI